MKISFLIFFLCGSILLAQVDTTLTTDKLIQDILEDASIDLEEDYLYDQLEELQDNPININSADLNTLLSIPILDLGTARLIIEQREKHGDFYSTNELKLIEGIDRNIAEALQLFTTIDTYEPETFIDLSQFSLEVRSRYVQDLQQRRGFKEGRYLGEEYKSYQRLKFRSTNLNAAILAEKDSGEKEFNDFTSFSLSLNEYSFIDKLTLGDYLVEFGQGLIYWGPYSFGKGAEAVRAISRSARTIRDYTSTDENQFFRGGAAKVNFGKIHLTAHYSNHNIDGNVDTSNGLITSLPISGLHRTDTELDRKNNVNEQTIGGIISAELFNGFDLGVAFQNIRYDHPLEKRDLFDPSGDNFNFYSTSYSWFYGNVRISGEVAYNEVSVANIHSLTWLLNQRLIFRNCA
ncbi:MAG: helix-hairpin-helix domain-containing protein [Melioribacteraceae bacterium]|nr:helix-hairpin-helix domain-containing protein [Melioribacteraceae bacterium]